MLGLLNEDALRLYTELNFYISDVDYPELKIKITTLTMTITINVNFVLTICHKTVDSLETVLGQSQVNRVRVPGVLDSVNYQPTGFI